MDGCVFYPTPKGVGPQRVSTRRIGLLTTRQRRSLLYRDEATLRVGERVVFSPMMFVDNEDDWIGEDLLVPFDQIYAYYRNDTWNPLNGFLFAEPLDSDVEEIAGMNLRSNELRKGVARIVYAGSPTEYSSTYTAADNVEVKPGDVVFFNQKMARRIEWPLWNTLNKDGNLLIIFQRKDIFALI